MSADADAAGRHRRGPGGHVRGGPVCWRALAQSPRAIGVDCVVQAPADPQLDIEATAGD
jgi:hypothetical protein